MKKITIKNVKRFDKLKQENWTLEKGYGLECIGEEDMEASDGDHTFAELYEHRCVLFIALCKQRTEHNCNREKFHNVWRSELHSDGTSFKDWFILGMGKEKGKQISYHLPIKMWKETEFAETLEVAPEWDGHTSPDVLERIKKL